MPRHPIQIPVRYFCPRAIRKSYEVQAWQALFSAVLCLTGGFILTQLTQSNGSSSSVIRNGNVPTICSITFDTEGEITEHSSGQKILSSSLFPIYATDPAETPILFPKENFPQPTELSFCANNIVPLQQSDDLLTNPVAENIFDIPESTLPPLAGKRGSPSKQSFPKAQSVLSSAKQKRTEMIATQGTNSDVHRVSVRYREAPKPPYPVSLRLRRSEGSVHVRIFVSAHGVPTAVDILSGSGFEEMDTTAETWIMRHWKFYPETINGQAVASVVSTHIHFKIN